MGRTVTVPDASDMRGLPRHPLKIRTRTSEGEIRPSVVVALMNDEMRVSLEARIKKDARSQGLPEPVIAPLNPKGRLSDLETTARMADLLLSEYDKYHLMFPAETLAKFLDERTGRTMQEAFRKGMPIDRDATRRAIGQLWKEAETRRKEKQ